MAWQLRISLASGGVALSTAVAGAHHGLNSSAEKSDQWASWHLPGTASAPAAVYTD